jgi:hypothetical protein
LLRLGISFGAIAEEIERPGRLKLEAIWPFARRLQQPGVVSNQALFAGLKASAAKAGTNEQQ